MVNLCVWQFQFMSDEIVECITNCWDIICWISDIYHLRELSFAKLHIAAFIGGSESQEIFVVLLSVSVLNHIIVYFCLLGKLSKTKWASWLQTAEKGFVEKLNSFHMYSWVSYLVLVLDIYLWTFLKFSFFLNRRFDNFRGVDSLSLLLICMIFK